MRKLTIIEHISLDGVIQAPGGPDEDRDDNFQHGGWSAPFSDPVIEEFILAMHRAPFDLLLGRRTYDIWSGYWPKAGSSLIADRINAATKFIATHRSDTLAWGPAESLGPDIVNGVRRAKAMHGPDLILWRSSTLTPVLLENELADEVILLVYPVLLGTGKLFFSDAAAPRELKLVSTKAGLSGVTINIYKPAGSLRTGTFAEPKDG